MSLPKIIADTMESKSISVKTTAQPLVNANEATETTCSIGFQAAPGNVKTIYIGTITSQDWQLTPGQSLSIDFCRPSDIYFRGDNAGDTLTTMILRTSGQMRGPAGLSSAYPAGAAGPSPAGGGPGPAGPACPPGYRWVPDR